MNIKPEGLIDWYKSDHARQYPDGTQLVFSNMTPRKSRIPGVDSITFFGLQYFIKEYLIKQWNENFFEKGLDTVLKRWKRRSTNALGPNSVNLDLIARLWEKSYLPLEIRALPEGSECPIGVPPLVLWNTHPDEFWLPNNIETIMSSSIWQACTSATLAREFYKEFSRGAIKTVGNTDFVPWQGHDFSFRGMSSLETACISGAAHLLYFTGSDTVPAIDFLEEYYRADSDKELIAGSVPATEHSVMCMGGKEGEIGTFQRLMKLYPTGILSVVSDTWDFWQVITEFLPKLKDQILARDGKLVIRPDSGDPADIICGVRYQAPKSEGWQKKSEKWEEEGAIECLWNIFGGTTNELGYKVLDPHIGLIYGDSISIERARDINARLEAKGFATTNWVAGVGSYTYQHNTRDTFGFAVKATYGEVEKVYGDTSKGTGRGGQLLTSGIEAREIFKDPKTDDGTKKSAKGLIAVSYKDGKPFMKDQATWDQVKNCAFQPVFKDGKLLRDQSLNDIRVRAKIDL